MSDIEEYRQSMARKNRIHAQARAILQRAQRAGIPEQYMRIKGEDFFTFLSKSSYKKDELDKIMHLTYEQPINLFKRSFLLIDGGTHQARRKAGFALLFRMIACDKFGRYESCRDIAHKLQVRNDFNRHPFAQSLKDDDVLFIGECDSALFSDKDDIGTFFDDILESREDSSFPTIISFVEPLGKLNIMKSKVYGSYLSELTRNGDLLDDGRILHIKVEG